MRTLIDGYNLMYAGGLLGRKFGPEGFRNARHRFLNDLAATLEPMEAHLTTVVFDASTSPPDVASSTRHKGMTILFAVDVASADDRIEDLIAHHSSPRTLTVVSSDNRIRRAATRRKARVMSADEYWCQMDTRKDRRKPPAAPSPIGPGRVGPASTADSAFWIEEFRELAESDEARLAFEPDPIFPSDDEIARIEREVDEEYRIR